MSDDTATTEDADLRVLLTALRPGPFQKVAGWGHAIPSDARHLIVKALEAATARPDTTTEWGVRDERGHYHRAQSEAQARRPDYFPWTVVRREVTAWTEADQ